MQRRMPRSDRRVVVSSGSPSARAPRRAGGASAGSPSSLCPVVVSCGRRVVRSSCRRSGRIVGCASDRRTPRSDRRMPSCRAVVLPAVRSLSGRCPIVARSSCRRSDRCPVAVRSRSDRRCPVVSCGRPAGGPVGSSDTAVGSSDSAVGERGRIVVSSGSPSARAPPSAGGVSVVSSCRPARRRRARRQVPAAYRSDRRVVVSSGSLSAHQVPAAYRLVVRLRLRLRPAPAPAPARPDARPDASWRVLPLSGSGSGRPAVRLVLARPAAVRLRLRLSGSGSGRPAVRLVRARARSDSAFRLRLSDSDSDSGFPTPTPTPAVRLRLRLRLSGSGRPALRARAHSDSASDSGRPAPAFRLRPSGSGRPAFRLRPSGSGLRARAHSAPAFRLRLSAPLHSASGRVRLPVVGFRSSGLVVRTRAAWRGAHVTVPAPAPAPGAVTSRRAPSVRARAPAARPKRA